MPRPATASAPTKAGDDGSRDRIAQLEVQLSATRASAARAHADAVALRERLDAQAARIDSIDAALKSSIDRLEATTLEAKRAAERPIPLEDLRARMSEVEAGAQSARAQTAAMRQELAENKRLDEARAARLASIEGRVARIEDDPRPNELRLGIDRLETRLLAMEREHHDLRGRLADAIARAEAQALRFADAFDKVDRVLARLAELEESHDALRAQSVAESVLPRVADLEALVVESGREGARLRAEIEGLRASLASATAASSGPSSASGKKRGGFGIAGIGPKMEAKLRASGVADAAALAALAEDDRARIATAIGVKRDKLDAWCEAARGS